MDDFMNFKGSVCLITGAGSEAGIGFACARLIGRLGARVILTATTDRIFDRARELNAEGINAKGMAADLMDRSQVERLADAIITEYGRIDVLINNAGMRQINKKSEAGFFSELSYEDWDMEIARNLTLFFNVTRNVIPYMKKQNYGRIVNISSVTGPVVSATKYAGYGAAKSAVIGMSRAIAIEEARSNITINNVLPGWIATASQSERGAEGGRNTPMGRSGTPGEVANMAVFLASKEVSYITGQTFIVDGGNTIQEHKGQKE